MISVAAELAEMHPQTLRMYEARGLIEPKRSPKGTRLYSHADVERLRRIQELTSERRDEPRGGRTGVRARGGARADAAQGRRAGAAGGRAQAEIARLEEVRREVKAEIVRYESRSTDLVPVHVVRRRRDGPTSRDRPAPPMTPVAPVRRVRPTAAEHRSDAGAPVGRAARRAVRVRAARSYR